MNRRVVIIGILVVIIVVCVIVYLIHRSKIKNLDVNILNSVYGSDGYFIHYTPLLIIFKNLIDIANYDPNYTQVEDGNEYKLVVKYENSFNFIRCSIVDNKNNILSESDFQMEWLDINEFYGQTMTKKISLNTLNIGHNKSVSFNLADETVNVKNNSWTGTKNNVIEFSNIASVGDGNFALKFKYENGNVVI